LLLPDELEALANDIKLHGLLNPVIRCQGKLLDGRNRLLACRAVGVKPTFRDVSAEDALVWARSQNVFRRHLHPNYEAFALTVLEDAELANPVLGKKRIRAYRKLRLLKEQLSDLVHRSQNGEDVLPILAGILKNKAQKPLTFFHALANRLTVLTPSISDGKEHVLVTLLSEAATKVPDTDTEQFYKKETIALLRKIAKEFEEHANTLDS
jgi:ParB-like chromosome segregation protein Spo0J